MYSSTCLEYTECAKGKITGYNMEELYSSVIEGGRVHSLDWSSLNLLALSISLNKGGFVGEGFGR